MLGMEIIGSRMVVGMGRGARMEIVVCTDVQVWEREGLRVESLWYGCISEGWCVEVKVCVCVGVYVRVCVCAP